MGVFILFLFFLIAANDVEHRCSDVGDNVTETAEDALGTGRNVTYGECDVIITVGNVTQSRPCSGYIYSERADLSVVSDVRKTMSMFAHNSASFSLVCLFCFVVCLVLCFLLLLLLLFLLFFLFLLLISYLGFLVVVLFCFFCCCFLCVFFWAGG